MKIIFPRTIVTLAFSVALTLCLFASSARADLTLANFAGTGFTGTYGTWIGNTTSTPNFVAVNATISGGGFLDVGPFDLTSFVSNNVQLSLRQGSGTPANDGTKNILLQLRDNNNVKLGYVFSMAGLPTSDQPFTIVARQLGNPNYASGGTVGSFNFAAVNQVELLGDFSGSNNLNLQLQNVTVVPEPDTFWVVILGGAVSLLVIRRIRRPFAQNR